MDRNRAGRLSQKHKVLGPGGFVKLRDIGKIPQDKDGSRARFLFSGNRTQNSYGELARKRTGKDKRKTVLHQHLLFQTTEWRVKTRVSEHSRN